MKTKSAFLILALIFLVACTPKSTDKNNASWQTQLDEQLPVLGHRNWILIVDKAFPVQNSEGIVTINTGEKLLPVLKYTLAKLGQSTHVKPIIFTDTELNFITPAQVMGINQFRDSLQNEIKNFDVQNIRHDSVFVRIDKASKLFRIVVLKTEETIPYSSVFLQLDCKYWSAEKQLQLEQAMKNQNN